MASVTYCGIDFHKRTSTICMMDEKGGNIERATIESKQLVRFLANKKNLMIGIEASGGTNHMVDKLKLSGHDVRIINPNKMALVGYAGKKTDDKDSEAIANCLRLNFISEVHHKSLVSRELKSLIVGREMLVRSKVNEINHIRGTLREYGLTIPAGVERFMQLADQTIAKVESALIRHHLEFLMEKVRSYKNRISEMEESLEQLTCELEMAQKIRTIPGVGLMTMCMFLAVTDDIKRFEDAKSFASYLGLVPREHSSGDKRRMGAITRSGSEVLRRYLIHGSRSVLSIGHRAQKHKDDDNIKWALALKKRVGMNKATVALAHRMARIAFAIMRDGTYYGEIAKNHKRPKVVNFTFSK